MLTRIPDRIKSKYYDRRGGAKAAVAGASGSK